MSFDCDSTVREARRILRRSEARREVDEKEQKSGCSVVNNSVNSSPENSSFFEVLIRSEENGPMCDIFQFLSSFELLMTSIFVCKSFKKVVDFLFDKKVVKIGEKDFPVYFGKSIHVGVDLFFRLFPLLEVNLEKKYFFGSEFIKDEDEDEGELEELDDDDEFMEFPDDFDDEFGYLDLFPSSTPKGINITFLEYTLNCSQYDKAFIFLLDLYKENKTEINSTDLLRSAIKGKKLLKAEIIIQRFSGRIKCCISFMEDLFFLDRYDLIYLMMSKKEGPVDRSMGNVWNSILHKPHGLNDRFKGLEVLLKHFPFNRSIWNYSLSTFGKEYKWEVFRILLTHPKTKKDKDTTDNYSYFSKQIVYELTVRRSQEFYKEFIVPNLESGEFPDLFISLYYPRFVLFYFSSISPNLSKVKEMIKNLEYEYTKDVHKNEPRFQYENIIDHEIVEVLMNEAGIIPSFETIIQSVKKKNQLGIGRGKLMLEKFEFREFGEVIGLITTCVEVDEIELSLDLFKKHVEGRLQEKIKKTVIPSWIFEDLVSCVFSKKNSDKELMKIVYEVWEIENLRRKVFCTGEEDNNVVRFLIENQEEELVMKFLPQIVLEISSSRDDDYKYKFYEFVIPAFESVVRRNNKNIAEVLMSSKKWNNHMFLALLHRKGNFEITKSFITEVLQIEKLEFSCFHKEFCEKCRGGGGDGIINVLSKNLVRGKDFEIGVNKREHFEDEDDEEDIVIPPEAEKSFHIFCLNKLK